MRLQLEEIAVSGGRGAAASGQVALVVLPFENRSTDPEDEYVSDGLTEEVITDLANLEGIRVISRTSAMKLKGTQKDVRTLARELDIQYVLSGRLGVQMEGGEPLEFGPSSVVDIPPGHDAWAAGDEPLVLVELSGNVVDFALPVRHARTVLTMLMTSPPKNAAQKPLT